MTNIYEINDLVDFLDNHNLTIKQMMYCLLLYYDKRHSKIEGTNKISRPLSRLYKYHTNIEKFSPKELIDLDNKGFIEVEKKNNKKQFIPDKIKVSNKFIKNWLGDSFKVKDLIDKYPKRVPNFNHPGKPDIPLCLFDDFEKLKKRYNSLVKTYKMHDRVTDLVEWGKENGKINVGITKFVNSKYWEDLQQMKEEGSTDNFQHT